MVFALFIFRRVVRPGREWRNVLRDCGIRRDADAARDSELFGGCRVLFFLPVDGGIFRERVFLVWIFYFSTDVSEIGGNTQNISCI